MIFHLGVILFGFLIEFEAVGKPGTTSTGDIHPQFEVIVTFFLNQRPDLAGRIISEAHRWYIRHVMIYSFKILTAPKGAVLGLS